MSVKTVLLTGGSGLVGTALAKHLVAVGYQVIILSRNPLKAKASQENNDNITFAHWNLKTREIDTTAVAISNIIVHLAGAGVVAKPWTDDYKKEIVDSRTQSSALIIKALNETPNKVEVVISASAIGWYGDDENIDRPFLESDSSAHGFLGETCCKWEDGIKPVIELGIRLVIFRFGIILSMEGGALKAFLKPLFFRIAGVLGSGKQVLSWIHIGDLSRIIQFAIENPGIGGTYNAVAPFPVTNKLLTITLAKALYGNFFIRVPVPKRILKIMLGDRSIEVLKSATVSSEKIREEGFEFCFPQIKNAIDDLAGEYTISSVW